MLKQAVILAGGQGARLRPITDAIPKALAPVNGRPFIEYLIEMLKGQGIQEIAMLTGYLGEKIPEALGDGTKYGVNIKYSHTPFTDREGREQESGLRVKNAAGLLQDVFLLLYCDNYWPARIPEMVSFYRKAGVLASTTVYNNKDCRGEYGCENNVHVSDDGFVLKYDKTRQEKSLNGVDMGFFILSKKILEMMPEGNFHFEKEILPLLVDKRQLVAYRTDHPYYFVTTLESAKRTGEFLKEKKAVFLDRDGVINKKMPEHDYVKHWGEFEFLPGAVEALRLLTKNAYQIYVVTNQRGVARGLVSERSLGVIHSNMERALQKAGAVLAGIYYCPHGTEEQCECRKPKPGLFFRAAGEHCLDLTKAIAIGDSQSDVEAGKSAGCKTILLGPGENILQVVQSFV